MGMFKRGKLTDREVKICGLKGKENLPREDIKNRGVGRKSSVYKVGHTRKWSTAQMEMTKL